MTNPSNPDENIRPMYPAVRSPRSAALAGILFAVLLSVSMFLITDISSTNPAEISEDRLVAWSDSASLTLGLVPFAGIAFLWFTGVIRDRLGDREDRFFATIFFGSGIIFVSLLFVWAATMGTMFAVFALAGDTLTDLDIYIFGFTFMSQMIGNYIVRMAGVYMFSIATLWTRASVMPRWLTIITFVVALSFLFFAPSIRESRYIFPAWVLLVSVYVLITNRRLETAEAAGVD